MLDITFLALLIGFLLGAERSKPAGEGETPQSQAAPAGPEIYLAGLLGAGLLAYIAAGLSRQRDLEGSGFTFDDLRLALAAYLPSVVMGLLSGWVLRRAIPRNDPKLFVGAAVLLLAPMLLSLGPKLADYVQEVKTPWFEATLSHAKRDAPVLQNLRALLDRSGDAQLKPKDYVELRRSLDGNKALAAIMPPPRSPPPEEAVADLILPHAAHAATELVVPAPGPAIEAAKRWMKVYVDPVLACVWKAEAQPFGNDTVERSLAPLVTPAAALLLQTNDALAQQRRLTPEEVARSTGDFVQGVRRVLRGFTNLSGRADDLFRETPSDPQERQLLDYVCVSQLAVLAWDGGSKPKACQSTGQQPAFCGMLAAVPDPTLVAATAYPYVVVARLFRRVGDLERGRRFLEAVHAEVLPPPERVLLLQELARFRRDLGDGDWSAAQVGAIELNDAILKQLAQRYSTLLRSDPCAEDDGRAVMIADAYAVRRYATAQMRNDYAFEILNEAQRRPAGERGAHLPDAIQAARVNYGAIKEIKDSECVLARQPGATADFSIDAEAIYPDTYGLGLLLQAVGEASVDQSTRAEAEALLRKAEQGAMGLPTRQRTAYLSTIREHRRAAELLR